jgi:outer membrane protein assembly factor BamA
MPKITTGIPTAKPDRTSPRLSPRLRPRLMLRRIFSLSMLVIVMFTASFTSAKAVARSPRVLKFQGIPLSEAQQIKRKFPYVFEREVTLGEVDEITRFLMGTDAFSNIEVVEKNTESRSGRELVLIGSLLRRIKEIQIKGNNANPSREKIFSLRRTIFAKNMNGVVITMRESKSSSRCQTTTKLT